MIHEIELLQLAGTEILARAALLTNEEIDWLVTLLSSTDDKLRYAAFQLLRERSFEHADVFPFWNVFCDKLASENSYQRSLGSMLLAVNARWVSDEQTAAMLDGYLALLHDEKPITVRQSIQSLLYILPSHPALCGRISASLLSLSLLDIRDTMRKLVLIDILNVLLLIREIEPTDAIDAYIFAALCGDLLDAKAKKQIRARMELPARG